MRRRGFTLVELSLVLAVMSVLLAVSIPVYRSIALRAQASEARAVLDSLAHAELMHFRDHGAFLECGPAREAPCWGRLGVQWEGSLRYGYRVELEGDSFLAVAEGDLDHDGVHSRLSLSGRDLTLRVENEFE